MSGLRVRLLLPDAASTGASQVHVALRDTSQEDAEHPTVAETFAELPAGGEAELYLPVEAGALDPRNRYSVWAHVTPGNPERLAPGDFITTAATPVDMSDIEQERTIPVSLQQI